MNGATVNGLVVRDADDFAEQDTLGDAGAELPDDVAVGKMLEESWKRNPPKPPESKRPANVEPDESEKIRRALEREKEEEDTRKSELEVFSLGDLADVGKALRPVVIDGLIRQGETANIVSSAKVGKSWLSYSLALAVARPREDPDKPNQWLQTYDCAAGRVLIVDNELHQQTLSNRLQRVCSAMGVKLPDVAERIHIMPLRGRLLDIYGIQSQLAPVKYGEYKLVIIDALYRALPEKFSENDNADMARLYNVIDCIAAQTGAAIVLIDHSPKGNQSEKSVTDVAAGGGAKGRAADAVIILREHEEPNAAVMEAKVRSFAPSPPICLKWFFPCWQPDEMLDPSKLKTAKPRKKLETEDKQAKRNEEKAMKDTSDKARILRAVDKSCQSSKPQSYTAIRKSLGLSDDRFAYLVARLEGTIERCPITTEMPNGGERVGGETLRRVDVVHVVQIHEKQNNIPHVDVCSEELVLLFRGQLPNDITSHRHDIGCLF